MSCTDCPLHNSAITNCMPGRGAHGGVMLVAQAPGGQEDMKGEALSGRVGQLLDQMLIDAGYDLAQVFKTNAVRCRPPMIDGKDRAPTPDEITACRKHLKAEIDAVQPEVIIALGDVALRALCKKSGVADKRGKEFALHAEFGYDCSVWPTRQPGYVLHAPTARDTIVADLRRVRDRHTAQIAIALHIADATNAQIGLQRDYVVALDIETETSVSEKGKKTYAEHPGQLALAGANAYVAFESPDALAALLNARQTTAELVTHNGWQFDIPKLRDYIDPALPWGYDTMVLAYLDDETQPLGLESLCVKYLGVKGWKEDRYAPIGSPELCEYNARDALNTLYLFRVLVERLGPRRMCIASEIILPGKIALDACSVRGIWIDATTVAAAKADAEKRIAEAAAQLRTFAPHPEYNPNSGEDNAAILAALGFTLPRTAKSNKAKIDRQVLNGIDHPFARALLNYRKAAKSLSTYIDPYEKAAASKRGRVHPTYHVYRRDFGAGGTVTGRTSASNPNVQNLDRKLKGFFSAPPGKVFVSADYSAIEFRIAADVADEQTILTRFADNPNWDPHIFFASKFYGMSEELIAAEAKAKKAVGDPNSMRQIAKSANFSQLYRGVGSTLVNYAAKMDVTLTPVEGEALHAMWHATFGGFGRWYVSVWEHLRTQGYVESATGRRRNFGDFRLLGKSAQQDALREACNFLVQSFACDIALLALRACHERALPIIGFIHDAILFEFDSVGEYEVHKETIRHALVVEPLQLLNNLFGVTIRVPLTIDITTNAKDTRYA